MKYSNLNRVYITSKLLKNQTLKLSGNIFYYCTIVLRMKILEQFRIFNQYDGEFVVQIIEINKKYLQVAIGNKSRDVKYLKSLALGMCIIKPDRFLEAIKAAVQLGVSEIIPIISNRTQFKNINYQRIKKCIIEAVEQSEGFVPPVLRLPISLQEFCNKTNVEQIIIANEEEKESIKIHSIKDLKGNIALIIGPEGGLCPKEKIELLLNPKVISISLGGRILRSEIAAITMIAYVNFMRNRK